MPHPGLAIAEPPASLETPISDGSTLRDVLADEDAEPLSEVAERNIRSQTLWRALETLPLREREVIELRFGLTGAHPHTLREAGSALGVSRERARQIEQHVLNKLRALPHTQPLRDAA